MRECLEHAAKTPVALAISNQRESVLAWSRRSGTPLGPMLGWQDARTAQYCAELAAGGLGTVVRARTGLSLDPMFSAPKMRWLLDAALTSGVDVQDVLLGTVDSWLVWRLTGEHLIEAGNASRTLLMNLRTIDWDEDLCAAFGVPRSALPEIRASDAGFGVTDGREGIPAGIPVAAVLADSHAALYQHGCTAPGSGKATYGTGSSVMTPCESPDAAPEGVATTLAWITNGAPTYAREGNIVASGAALDWMARILGAPEGLSGGAFLTDLAADVAGGVAFVPAFSGLGAPYWDREATGVLTGVTAGTSRAHLARAALEAVAHQVTDVVEAIEADGGARIEMLHADGGATASGLLMQLQADLLQRPILVGDVPEASALGAAALAFHTMGLATAAAPVGTVVTPRTMPGGWEPHRRAWADAVARARGRALHGGTAS
jgi:glycerol kinase